MRRTAVFVDAGYVFAQGSVLLTGTKQPREFLSLSIQAILTAFDGVVKSQSGLPLLRVYWYDAMRHGRLSPEQEKLADSGNIKLRLGQLNSNGEQKGVDALIVTDLIELARNQAIADAVLMSGDEDIRIGVVLAQQFGVRVHLVGIHPLHGNQSRALIQEADTTTEWDKAKIGTFLAYSPPVAPLPSAAVVVSGEIDTMVESLVAALSPSDLAELKALFASGSISIPAEHDKKLLRVGRRYHEQQTLNPSEKEALRVAFLRLVLAR
ncbi:MAG: NYN domain-containing protein [Alphaproteobacteria bacterium]